MHLIASISNYYYFKILTIYNIFRKMRVVIESVLFDVEVVMVKDILL